MEPQYLILREAYKFFLPDFPAVWGIYIQHYS